MIDLHYCATPNGRKVLIFLEETGIPYESVLYDLFKGEHFTPEFRSINPNYKLPVIVDHNPIHGNSPFPVFETGAILLYLADKTGQFLASSGARRSIAQQWLFWQTSGLGPMMGQAAHFVRYAPEGQEYAVARYMREMERLLHVLEYRLGEADYVAEEYSIADMAIWPLIQALGLVGLNLDPYPAISSWAERIASRPAVLRAMGNSDLAPPEKYVQLRATVSSEAWSNMFGDRMHEAARASLDRTS